MEGFVIEMYCIRGHNQGFVYGVRTAVHSKYYSNDYVAGSPLPNQGQNFMTKHALCCSKEYFSNQTEIIIKKQQSQADVRKLFNYLPYVIDSARGYKER